MYTGEEQSHFYSPLVRFEGTSVLDAPPSVFTALREQLGLAIKPEKSPIDVLVIDPVEMPPEN
jgi:uncharacterized protein (TIGR03435 family)